MVDPSSGAALAKAAAKLGRRAMKQTELERLAELCQSSLQQRNDAWSAAEYTTLLARGDVEPLIRRLLFEPYEFSRREFIDAVGPHLGDVSADMTATEFAGALADVVEHRASSALRGDDVVRFEAARARPRSGSLGGDIDASWAPISARRMVTTLANESPVEASALRAALSGEGHRALDPDSLRTQIRSLGAWVPSWMSDGSALLWESLGLLATAVGEWATARAAFERAAHKPGVDRERALAAAASAAVFGEEVLEVARLSAVLGKLNSRHPAIALFDSRRLDDASDVASRLEQVDGALGDERLHSAVLAGRAMVELAAGNLDAAKTLSTEANVLAPEELPAMEATASVLIEESRPAVTNWRPPDRAALFRAAQLLGAVRSRLLDARRTSEATEVLGRVVKCLATAGDAQRARQMLSAVPVPELATDESLLTCVDAAFAVGERAIAAQLLEQYEGPPKPAALLRAHLLVGTDDGRAEGVGMLDEEVLAGSGQAATTRLVAAAAYAEEVSWSDLAEQVVERQSTALAAYLKARWLDARGSKLEAARLRGRHANDPRIAELSMTAAAERQEWVTAAHPARVLAVSAVPIPSRLLAAEVLRRAGDVATMAIAVDAVLADSTASHPERSAAFGIACEGFLAAGQLARVAAYAEATMNADLPDAVWYSAFVCAVRGDFVKAHHTIGDSLPTTSQHGTLAAQAAAHVLSPPDAVARIAAVAGALESAVEAIEFELVCCARRCKPDELSPALEARASPRRFVETFPRSTMIRRVSFDSDAERESARRALARARDEHEKAVAAAAQEVLRRDDLDVGYVARTGRFTVAEAWCRLEELPIQSIAEADIDAEHADAVAAEGGVLLDVSAVHALAIVGDGVVTALRADFPYAAPTLTAMADLMSAIEVRPSTDAKADWEPGPTLLRMYELALHLAPPPDTSAWVLGVKAGPGPSTDDVDEDIAEAATRTGMAVYSDDRAIRRRLRDRGIPCFGTLTLLDVLTSSGAIADDWAQAARNRMLLGTRRLP
jgi:hypothetical protein